MSTSNTNNTVYHPLGAVRLLSPAEQQSAGSSTRNNVFRQAVDVLRRFARVYVASQEHRNGF